jgi:hypothetical protein
MPRIRLTDKIAKTASITERLDKIASDLEQVDPQMALAIDQISDRLEGRNFHLGSSIKPEDRDIYENFKRVKGVADIKIKRFYGNVKNFDLVDIDKKTGYNIDIRFNNGYLAQVRKIENKFYVLRVYDSKIDAVYFDSPESPFNESDLFDWAKSSNMLGKLLPVLNWIGSKTKKDLDDIKKVP